MITDVPLCSADGLVADGSERLQKLICVAESVSLWFFLVENTGR